MVLVLRLSVLYGLFSCKKKLADWFCITEVESVYCAVRNWSFYNTVKFRLWKVKSLSTKLQITVSLLQTRSYYDQYSLSLARTRVDQLTADKMPDCFFLPGQPVQPPSRYMLWQNSGPSNIHVFSPLKWVGGRSCVHPGRSQARHPIIITLITQYTLQ